MNYLLGVDAGNTKTIAVVATPNGDIVGYGRSGCGDIYSAGNPVGALAAVDSAVGDALRAAGVDSGEVSAAAFSMAGCDWPEDFRLLEEAFRERYGSRIKVVNDAIGGLRAGAPEGSGVAVILGTGLAVGARGKEGRMWHVGFWVRTLGSSSLIERLQNAVVAAELGFRPPTALKDHVLRLYGVDTVEQFLHAITRRENRISIGKGLMVSALLDAAVAGDEIAEGIVDEYVDGCGNFAVLAADRVGFGADDPLKLVFSGGQLRHASTILYDGIIAKVCSRFPQAVPVRSRLEPVSGALLWAFDCAGIPFNQDMLDRITASMPPASFFESKQTA